MILLENKTNHLLDTSHLEQIALHLSDKDIELILTDDVEIGAVNLAHRGIEKATDVLSFPLEAVQGFPLGSIMISIDKAEAVAQERGHGVDDEIALLFIHGLLHLLGFDHENDSGQMREREAEVVRYFQLPDSLIERNV